MFQRLSIAYALLRLFGAFIFVTSFKRPLDRLPRFLSSGNVQLVTSVAPQSNQASTTLHESVSYDSPCKINLFLRILGRRDTGYHDLASLFQVISLKDTLSFELLPPEATKDEMTCSDESLTVDANNLVRKALQLMRDKTGIPQYFRVHLDKVVPMQAGLGGGSGNAATAMFAFYQLVCSSNSSHPAITLSDLQGWAGEIGSDISFFFSSGTAFCSGRGEIVDSLSPLSDSNSLEVHVFKPPEGLSTKAVISALDLAACAQVSPDALLKTFTSQGVLSAAKSGQMINDLETPSFQLEPRLLSLKQRLQALVPVFLSGAMMSGSGTSVIAVGPKGKLPAPALKGILQEFPDVLHYTCSFVNRPNDLSSWYQTRPSPVD